MKSLCVNPVRNHREESMCEAYGNYGEYENQVGVNGKLGNGSKKNEISTLHTASPNTPNLLYTRSERRAWGKKKAPLRTSRPPAGGAAYPHPHRGGGH